MKDLTADTDAIEWLGVCYKTILSPEQTGGAMSIVDSWSPVGSGPPRHVHGNEDETFVMISGTCKVWIDGEELTAGPGQSVFIPRGMNLTFKVDRQRAVPASRHFDPWRLRKVLRRHGRGPISHPGRHARDRGVGPAPSPHLYRTAAGVRP